MLAMTSHKTEDKAHDEDDRVQTICGKQGGLRTTVRDDRAGDDECQHGADGAAGQYEVNQFWRGHSGLL